ncbi:hypothetical protein ACFY12_34295 [Streptomyces sp. NPDC001339]|uniref:hypothetical protein n=1 Tax=Streptomyces sp. NPDC001339 TaxID=3364563 RepID=UPI0036C7E937
MPETTTRPEPRTTALSLIRTTALDEVARREHSGDAPPPANWEMYNGLTATLGNWHAADTLREDSLLLTEWLAVEFCGYLFQQLNQDRARLDRWLRDFGDQVCQSQQHEHPAGPTAMEIMSVVAGDVAAHPEGPAGAERLAGIGLSYLWYLREDHEVEDAREMALTFALWAGQQLAALMHHDAERIRSCMDARDC